MRFLPFLAAIALSAAPARATPCGDDFVSFVTDLRQEAVSRGHDPSNVDRFFTQVRQDPAVLRADRAQGVFQKSFTEFAQRLISSSRLSAGRARAGSFDAVFDRIEAQYGVSRGILLAFWAFETDFGGFQGDFNTLNALVTLAHDCRRPALFRPQIFAALKLFDRAILIQSTQPAPGPARSAWCRCCPRTSLTMESMATVTGRSRSRPRLRMR